MDELTRLAVAARDGDRLALSMFVRRSQPDVWRLCAHLVGRDLADDACQDAFMRAIGALPAYRAESSARTWLLSITRRACADVIRRAQRRRKLLTRLAPRASDELVEHHEDGVALDELVSRLDPDRRTAFVLTQVLGLSYDEAAEVCECPVGTIRSRVSRARADLLADYRAEGDDQDATGRS